MAVAASAPGSLWICAALSDVDRDVAATAVDGRIDVAGHDTGGAAVRMLAVDPDVLAGAYTSIANGTLWPVNHGLGDTPAFDDEWRADWERYVAYNQQFAEAIADEAATGAKVLVQDYHLNLVPAALRRVRPDLRIGHFTHTPWATPEDYSQLPRDVGRAIVNGLLGADSLGFHSPRWAEDFAGCARDAGASVDVPLRVHPLGVDPAPLIERASQPDVAERVSALRAVAGPLSGRLLPVQDGLEFGPAGRCLPGLPAGEAAGLRIGWQEGRLMLESTLPSARHPLRVNGVVTQCVALQDGDQNGVAMHRFVLEAPGMEPEPEPVEPAPRSAALPEAAAGPSGEVWWLIATAAALALAIALVLLVRF